MKIKDFKRKISENRFDNLFAMLYGKSEKEIYRQRERYIRALDSFGSLFPNREDVRMFSASGRTEIGGNHTDHQHGVVLGGAVNLDVIATVSFHNERVVRVRSEGYAPFEFSLDDLCANAEDSGTARLTKGVIAKFSEKGIMPQGFDMYCISDVLGGGGISSSAAYETLLCTIIDIYYNEGKCAPFEIAQIGKFAENVYFGKKCGLLDQTITAFGGLVSVDFKDSENPEIEEIAFDFSDAGYLICITDTKSTHENLTDEYDAIGSEMREVAAFFGCEVLGEVCEEQFYENISKIRGTCSDRAILRAMHFFGETCRAKKEAEALKAGNIDLFLKLVNESGDSSCELLQNLYSCKNLRNREIPLAIALSKKILDGRGAVRVHGGGFAGTIQAFVPAELSCEYVNMLEGVFGKGACFLLNIRPCGGMEIKE